MRHYQTVNGARRVAIPRCPCRKTHPPLGSGRLPYVSMMKATDLPQFDHSAELQPKNRPRLEGITDQREVASRAVVVPEVALFHQDLTVTS